MRLVTIALVISTFLFGSAATAATYYVSTTGNDAANGSEATPFRTIKVASKVATAGDVVNVRGGTYGEGTIISSRGTAAAPIVFRAMPGETVILDGSSLTGSTPVVSLNGSEYVDFSGFEVRNSATYIGILVWNAKNTRVLDNHVHHTRRHGIYAAGDTMGMSSDITVSGNSVHDAVLENEFHNMGSGGWAGGVVVSKTERAIVTGNRIWNNDGEGLICLRSNNVLVQDNEISDNFSAYLYLDNARFITADRNLIYSTGNTRYYRDGRPGAGIAVANEYKDVQNPSSDNVFTNNIVVGTRWGFSYGNFQFGGGLKNTKVLNNTFYGTTSALIDIDGTGHANSVVQNNIFYAAGTPDPSSSGSGAGVSYSNNLWYGGNAGAAAGSGDVLADPLLSNPGGRTAADYRLRAGSAALAKALNLTSLVAHDHFGALRLIPFDIGAHQFSGGAVLDLEAPAIPSALRVSGGDATSVTIAWSPSTDNVGVTGYTIRRNGSVVANVTSPAWTDRSGLTESVVYTYQVQAVDAAGNRSPFSAALPIAWSASHAEQETPRDTEAPTMPAGLRADAATASSVTLHWTPATDNVTVAGYHVYRDGALVATSLHRNFTDSGLQAATTYTYAVATFDAAGNTSPVSAPITVRTGAGKTRSARR